MAHGFTCGYCLEEIDTPYREPEASQRAHAVGWRMTDGHSKQWGDGSHYTCPNCVNGSLRVVPLHVGPVPTKDLF